MMNWRLAIIYSTFCCVCQIVPLMSGDLQNLHYFTIGDTQNSPPLVIFSFWLFLSIFCLGTILHHHKDLILIPIIPLIYVNFSFGGFVALQILKAHAHIHLQCLYGTQVIISVCIANYTWHMASSDGILSNRARQTMNEALGVNIQMDATMIFL